MEQTVTLRLRADGSGLVGEFRSARGEVQVFSSAAVSAADRAGSSFRRAGGEVSYFTSQLEATKRLLGGLVGFEVGRRIVADVTAANSAWAGYVQGLRAVLGTQQAATAELDFVGATAQRLGLSLQTTAADYVRLAAASRGTQLEGQATRDIFVAVSEAARVLHLSAEDTSGTLNAIQQMMSKGSVQAEELRGQLGERLPGAFNIAAQALGVTTAQLGKMLQSGQVAASDLLPKLASQLHKLYGGQAAEAANGPAAQISRLKNAVFELEIAIGDAGFMTLLGKAAQGAQGALLAAANYARGFSVTLDLIADAATRAESSLKSVDGGAVLRDLDENAQEVTGNIAAEFRVLPQSIRTAFTIVVGEADQAWIRIRAGAQLLANGVEQEWLSIQEAWASLTGEMKVQFGSAVDAVLQRAGTLATRLSALYGAVGLDTISTKLAGYAEQLNQTATFEQRARAEMAQTTSAFDARRAALQTAASAITAQAAAERAASSDAINAAVEERQAALARADATAKVATAVADLATKARAQAAATQLSAKEHKEAETAAKAYATAQQHLADILAKARGEMSEGAKIEATYEEHLRDIAATGGKMIQAIRDQAKATHDYSAVARETAQVQSQVSVAIAAETAARDKAVDTLARQQDIVGKLQRQYQDDLTMLALGTNARRAEKEVIDARNEALQKHIAFTADDEARVRAMSTAYYAQRDALEVLGQEQDDYFNAQRQGWSDVARTTTDWLFSTDHSFRSFWKGMADVATNFFKQLVYAWLNTRLQLAALSLFGGSGAAFAGTGGVGSQLVGAGVNAAAGSVFGSGGGGGGALGGGSTLFSPTQWFSAGRSLYDGFMYGTKTGFGSSPLGSFETLGGNNVYTPSALGYGLNIAGGLYAGYNAYRGAGGGASGLAAGAAYGIGTVGLMGGLSSLAIGGGFGAGMAGALGGTAAAGAGMTGLAAAIPVIGWVALIAMVVDKLTHGDVFGTGYQTQKGGTALHIGPGGSYAEDWQYQVGRKALFGGRKDRTIVSDSNEASQQAAHDLYSSIEKLMTDDAKRIKATAGPVLEASLETVAEYDKKGKVTAMKYLVRAYGQAWEEASQDDAATRLAAEATLEVLNRATSGVAGTIAQQWQGDLGQLSSGVDFLLAAQEQIASGNVAMGSSLQDVYDVVSTLGQSNEALADTYTRLLAETKSVQDAFALAGDTLTKTGKDLIDFADQVATAAGGGDAAQQLWQRFFTSFYSQAELAQRQADVLRPKVAADLTAVGLRADTTMEQFRTAFEQQLPTLTADQVVQWLRLADEMASFNELLGKTVDKTAALKDYAAMVADLDNQLAAVNGGGMSEFQKALADIGTQERNTIQALNDAAKAAGLQGAREADLSKVHQLAAARAAAAAHQLEATMDSLIQQLYGSGADQLSASASGASSALRVVSGGLQDLANAATTFRDSMLLDDQLSPLNTQQQLQEALKQLRATGDEATGRRALELARKLTASGADYTTLFDQITALVKPAAAHSGSGGSSAASGSAQAAGKTLTAEQRVQLAQQLAQSLADLSGFGDRTYEEIAKARNLDLNRLGQDLGLKGQALYDYLDSLKADSYGLDDLSTLVTGQVDRIVAAIQGQGATPTIESVRTVPASRAPLDPYGSQVGGVGPKGVPTTITPPPPRGLPTSSGGTSTATDAPATNGATKDVGNKVDQLGDAVGTGLRQVASVTASVGDEQVQAAYSVKDEIAALRQEMRALSDAVRNGRSQRTEMY